MSPAPITIAVPAYAGAQDLRRCLESVLRHAESGPAAELLVIDDASPGDEVGAVLDEFVAGTHPLPVAVERHRHNAGFVATANEALARASGDVVLLNADTVVTDGWLARPAAAATDDVATVTPLSNFGSICTLTDPVRSAFALDSDAPLIDACGAHVARHGLGVAPPVITGVGFCLYITRRALDLAGPLDAATFGMGYGEEVDFCLRATRLGLRHVVEDRTFVYHRGGVSFGTRRNEGLARGSALLHERYGFFGATNQRERRRDPLAASHRALELSLAERDPLRRHVVHLLHNAPDALGGTEKHLDALLSALEDEFDFSVLFPVESGFVLRSRWLVDDEPVHRQFLLPGGPRKVTKVDDELAGEALRLALDLIDTDVVHIQNLIGHSLAPLRVLDDFPGTVVCSVRDLYLACPNHSLLFLGVEPCGVPDDLAVCARCLPATVGLDAERLDVWRTTVDERLGAVDHWVFASRSAADFFLRVYAVDNDRLNVIPHGAILDVDAGLRSVDERHVMEDPLAVAFVGMGWTKKGLDVVNHLAEATVAAGITVHHLGELRGEASRALRTHGPYDNAELPMLLRSLGIHVVALPGPYAETFGHVMTESLATGLPVIGAGYGALGERIRATAAGWTIDPSDPGSVVSLVRDLDRCRWELLRATRRACAAPLPSVADGADAYAMLYRSPTPTERPVRVAEGGRA